MIEIKLKVKYKINGDNLTDNIIFEKLIENLEFRSSIIEVSEKTAILINGFECEQVKYPKPEDYEKNKCDLKFDHNCGLPCHDITDDGICLRKMNTNNLPF